MTHIPEPAEPARTIRLVIQQPALPKYRIPVFRELARRPSLKVTVYHGESDGLPSAQAQGFEAHFVKERTIKIGRGRLFWHSPQWRCATKRYADVMLMTWSLPFVSMVPALLRAKFAGVPTILWGHGYSKQEAGWRLRLRFLVTRLASALLFYNHTTAERFIKMGVDHKRVFVALNALDQAPIQQARTKWLSDPDKLKQFQHDNNLAGKDVILFVSRLDPANRVDLLLHAADRMRQQGRESLRIVIVGKGEDGDRLKELSRSLNLDSHVHFAGAIYEEDQLAPWFISAKAFCYPANIGLSLLHAFGYGLPVVTSDRIESQNPEIEALEHERNGLLYRHGDADALAAALGRLLDQTDFAAQLSAHAHQTATARFTLANMVDGMEAAVRFCVSESKQA